MTSRPSEETEVDKVSGPEIDSLQRAKSFRASRPDSAKTLEENREENQVRHDLNESMLIEESFQESPSLRFPESESMSSVPMRPSFRSKARDTLRQVRATVTAALEKFKPAPDQPSTNGVLTTHGMELSSHNIETGEAHRNWMASSSTNGPLLGTSRDTSRLDLSRTLPPTTNSSSSVWKVRKSSMKVLVLSWNVGGSTPPGPEFHEQVAKILRDGGAQEAPLVVIGLQEVCALNLHSISHGGGAAYTRWSEYWSSTLQKFGEFELLTTGAHACEMVGLQLLVFSRRWLLNHLSFKAKSQVKCGAAGLTGNKGAVGWRMNIYQTSLCFVNAHLAAGHGAKSAEHRRMDICNIEGMSFEYRHRGWRFKDHDLIFWMGDTNSRLMINDDHAQEVNTFLNAQLERGTHGIERIIQEFGDHDELTSLRQKRKIFADYNEAKLTFPPTYKLKVGSQMYEADGSTSHGKIRIPGWTDRILWRTGSHQMRIKVGTYGWSPELTQSDHRAVYLSCEVLLTSISAPQIQGDQLVALLRASAVCTGQYPIRGFAVAVKKWRISLKWFLFYGFFNVLILFFWFLNVMACFGDTRCPVEVMQNKACVVLVDVFLGNAQNICKEEPVHYYQVLWSKELLFLQSFLFFQFFALTFWAIVRLKVFRSTVYVMGSEVIASHLDVDDQEMKKQPCCQKIARRMGEILRSWFDTVIFFVLSQVILYAWLHLGLDVTVWLWGPIKAIPVEILPPEDCQCWVQNWHDLKSMEPEVYNDWRFRQSWAFGFAFLPWVVMLGTVQGTAPFWALKKFYCPSSTFCEQLKEYRDCVPAVTQFGIVAFAMHIVPIFNILAPVAKTIGCALWAVDIERLLQSP